MIKCYSNSRLWLAMEEGTLERAGLPMPPDFFEFEENFVFDEFQHSVMTITTSHGEATIYCHPMVTEDAARLFMAYGRIVVRFLHETDAIYEDGRPVWQNAVGPLQRLEQIRK